MSRAARNRWIDVIGVIMTLAVAGALMYALLPAARSPSGIPDCAAQATRPECLAATNTTVALLTIFVVGTAVGAPITLAIVLALIMRKVAPDLSSGSSGAPAVRPSVKPQTATASTGPKELSRGEVLFWRIAAAVLSLIFLAGLMALLWPTLTAMFGQGM